MTSLRPTADLYRYLAASVVALVVDTAVLSAALRLLHFGVAWSATLGFIAGALVSYLLSIRWVFRSRALSEAPALEFATFIGIGVAGLGITQLLLWVGVTELNLLPEAVKLAAAGATFTFNYSVRKALLFVGTRHARGAAEA